jgi:hypothetical protein
VDLSKRNIETLPSLEEIGFVILHATIDKPGAKGNDGGEEKERRATQRPLCDDGGVEKGGAKNHEENAVGHANDADGLRLAPEIFEGHGDEEEDEKGDAFDDRDGAQAGDGVGHFFKGI